MTQNRNRQQLQRRSADNLPEAAIEQIIENQKQQLLLQAQELKLREKEIEANTRLAEKEMTLQADLLKNRPSENRKTFKVMAWAVIGVIALILFFFGFCVVSGYQNFAIKFFGYAMYVVTTLGGYYAGRRSKVEKKNTKVDLIENAEEVK